MLQQPKFLPMSRLEMNALGWRELDVLLVTGDAYVDHPSFGMAIIGRALVATGFKTGILAQPDWKQAQNFLALGRPRLFAGVTAGAMDSMVANYTANKKIRRSDAYTPGGLPGRRPNRACTVYANRIKEVFPGLPVILGGIEASLRRLAHYDYWKDALMRSLLLDAKATAIVYGMGESIVVELARLFQTGRPIDNLPGIAHVMSQAPAEAELLPTFEAIQTEPELLGEATLAEEKWRLAGKTMAQAHGSRFVVVNPPPLPLNPDQLDAIYDFPFTRQAHPNYTESIPALATVANSIVTHRGCYGGCSFCALGAHQGKLIQSRSEASIEREARKLTQEPFFHGTITDLGGPSANMYRHGCGRKQGPCARASCLVPEVCAHLQRAHGPQLELLKRLQALPGVKHVFIASGIRYDLALEDPEYISGLLLGEHISGAWKVAPEHTDAEQLRLMRKPPVEIFRRFIETVRRAAGRLGQKPYFTAYVIASFPGSSAGSARDLAKEARRLGLRITQLQDFIPLPMTLAAAMYFSGRDPSNGRSLPIPRNQKERDQQRRILLGQIRVPMPGEKKNNAKA